ncbi:MAG: FkbM family methyltransferase [Thermoflexus sp.]|uniref:FkbM family methyltransferase n=1 Tax=Thermoflexus sp. TaxID=1969742 RepID=UPI0025D1FE82|nr:FkbM family methyltransferase [Thermoflexus sp.]MCS6964863.1 FkbM family methyltransferase [Thermoflexus sp.]MDW8185389.1 FkbM family methyltransferase [Anaerolineae bacterium]
MRDRICDLWQILRAKGLPALSGEIRRFVERRIRAVIAWRRRTYAVDLDGIRARCEIRSYAEALNMIRTYQTEAPCLRHLVRHLRSTDTFWDVGAYYGLYSLLAAQICRQVVAFEPYPPNAQRILANAARNLYADRIRVLELALSDRQDVVSFDLRGGERAFMMGHVDPRSASPLRVLAVPGDALVAQGIPPPDVVKIDVEGHECEVLAGMQQILRTSVRQLICEVHASALARRNRSGCVERFLEGLGFRVLLLQSRRTEYFIWADREGSAMNGPG